MCTEEFYNSTREAVLLQRNTIGAPGGCAGSDEY